MDPVLKIRLRCDGVAETHEFARFPVRLGREYDCELRLEQGFISRHHARIEREGDQLFLQDEGSRNGIVCDGRRLTPHQRVALTDGSQVRIKRLLVNVHIAHATVLAAEDPHLEKATSLYADHAIDPALVDRMATAPHPAFPAVEAAAQPHPARPGSGAELADQTALLLGPDAGSPLAAASVAAFAPAPVSRSPHPALAELHDMALAVLPDGPAVTSPNIDALLDGLEGAAPIHEPGAQGAGIVRERAPSELADTGDWILPASLGSRLGAAIRRTSAALAGAARRVARVLLAIVRAAPRALAPGHSRRRSL